MSTLAGVGLWLCLSTGSGLAAGDTAPDAATAPDQPGATETAQPTPPPPAAPAPAAEAATPNQAAAAPAEPVSLPTLRKIMIVGDSFAVGLAMTMEQSMRPKGTVALSGRGKVSSGLNSPRFYDWEKALNDFLGAERPEALVVMLGGNDAKNGPGTIQWADDYRAKAKRLLDIAAAYGAKVFWVGLPPMREKSFSQRAWTANEAVRGACTAAPGCRFIESWDLFADAAGNFCAKKPVGGKAKSLRGKDGVHFSPTGCKLLTDRIASDLQPPAP